MRRHLRWILLLIAVPASYFTIMGIHFAIYSSTNAGPEPESVGWVLLRMLILLAAIAVPIVFLVVAINAMKRVYRGARRAKGKFSKYEQVTLDQAQHAASAWECARRARSDLLVQRVPATIQQWDVVPYAEEQFFARLVLNYARYYGQDVTFGQTSTLAFGHPAFVVGAMALSAITNAGARSRAAARSAPQWRERQSVTVYVSNRRLAVCVGGQWLSFDYAAMVAIFPEVSSSTLVCQFDGTEPMMLSGDEAAIAAVFTVAQTHGTEALRSHPALCSLEQPAPEPALPPL